MNAPLLTLEQVTYRYPGSAAPALSAISLAVRAGEWVGLAGPNGAGKTTLLRLVSGIFLPTSGAIRVAGHDPAVPGEVPALRRALGMVQANAGMQIVANTVEEDIAFGLSNLGTAAAEMRRRVDAVLAQLAITHLARRLPHTLSGGEEQLVALAGVLVLEPRVLVLDEPTAHLDADAAARVRAVVAGWHQRSGGGIIWISHAVEELAGLARVIGLTGGRIIFDGPPDRLWRDSAPRRTLHLALPAAPALLTALRDTPATPGAGDPVAEIIAAARARPGRGAMKTRQASAAPSGSEPVLTMTQLDFSYRSGRDKKIIFRDAGVDIAPGLTLLVGASGSGKTTLLNLLFGFARPARGAYHYRGVELFGRGKDIWYELRQRLGYLFQFPERQLFAATVREELAAGLVWRGMFPPAAQARVEEWVREEEYLSPAWLDRNPFTLSQGEQRQVAVASVLILTPEILLCDEPLAGLDGAQAARLTEIFRRFLAGGGTIVAATHQVAELWPLATALAVVADGGIRACAPAGDGRELAAALAAARVALPPLCSLLERAATAAGLTGYPACAEPAAAADWLARALAGGRKA